MPDQNSTLTAANAVITLVISGIFSSPQILKGFSTDNVYEVGDQQVTETLMGVDGRLSGGYVNNPVVQTFTLQADSPSNNIFDYWALQQRLLQETFVAQGSTLLKSVGTEYISNRGFLVTKLPLPTAGKILQPRKFVIHWESVQEVAV